MTSDVLVEFLFRLTFGVAAAMCVTPAKWVTSGFFRVHLWVLLGVQTLAAAALWSAPAASAQTTTAFGRFWLAVAAAVASYLGAVIWMYEKATLGKTVVAFVAGCALAACLLPMAAAPATPVAMQAAERITGGLLLGLVTTAMLLGHWYLNTPTMKLQPLRRLIVLLGAAIGLRMVVCLAGAWLEALSRFTDIESSMNTWMLFVSLRWLTGLLGLAVVTWMTWQTLKIPNTQSATGILYAGVILAFIGELTSQLLSAEAKYPI
jgi:hypothetical protein